MDQTPAMQSPASQQASFLSPLARHKQRWALGGLIAATTASVVLSLSAWAGGPDEGPGKGDWATHHQPGMMMMGGESFGAPFGGRHLQRLLDDAKVSDAQRAQIKQISDKAQADLKALFDEGRGLHEQGLAIWAAPKIDANAAEALRQKVQAHHDKVSKRIMQAMLDVGNVLTPEQRATVAAQMKKHHEDMMRRMEDRRAHRHGNGNGGGGGGGEGEGATGQQPEGQ